jgi:hypothetical protein
VQPRGGKPQTCKNLFNRVSNRCRHRFGVEGTKTLQEIIPDLLIDGRFLSTTLDGVGAGLLRGMRTLADVKTKPCDDKYPAGRSGRAQLSPNGSRKSTGSTTRKRENSIWSSAQHQAAQFLSRKNSMGTDKRAE